MGACTTRRVLKPFHTLGSRMAVDRARGMLEDLSLSLPPLPPPGQWGKFVTQASRGRNQTAQRGDLSMTRDACAIEGTAEK